MIVAHASGAGRVTVGPILAATGTPVFERRPGDLQGNVMLAAWLVNNGAYESLTKRDVMGSSPLDVAYKFGPHVECQRFLASVLVDRGKRQSSIQLLFTCLLVADTAY